MICGSWCIKPQRKCTHSPAAAIHQRQSPENLRCLFLKGSLSACAIPPGKGSKLFAESPGGIAMKQMLNTLFVTSEDLYLSLDGENVVANRGQRSRRAVSAAHAVRNSLLFLCRRLPRIDGSLCAAGGFPSLSVPPRGRFLARVAGETSGNVLLRRTQYRMGR